jgi:hypothetical protein
MKTNAAAIALLSALALTACGSSPAQPCGAPPCAHGFDMGMSPPDGFLRHVCEVGQETSIYLCCEQGSTRSECTALGWTLLCTYDSTAPQGSDVCPNL